MIGAFVSAALVQTAHLRHTSQARESGRYVAAFWVVALFLAIATLIPAGALPREAVIVLSVPFRSELFQIEPATLLLLALLSLTCGAQNNLFLVERNLVFRTTHLTGTTSDLATHLARLVFRTHSSAEARHFEIRLALLRGLNILSFFCGAAAGFVAHRLMGRMALTLPLLNAVAVAVFVTIYFYVHPRLPLPKRSRGGT